MTTALSLLHAQAWLDVSALLDRQLSPLGLQTIEALAVRPGETIVDIGCGAGETVLQLAARVGPGGQVIGVDIAPSLLARAQSRACGLATVRFIDGDAAALDLPPASVDGLYSRFGVMGFDEPVPAFRHLRTLLKPGGRLAFVCWRSLQENELDILPLRAAGLEAEVDPTPFRFEDPAAIRTVLTEAGFRGITVRPHDEAVSSGGVDAMLSVLLKVGPLGKIVRENTNLRALAEPRLRAALAARVVQGQVALNAAVWIVTAVA